MRCNTCQYPLWNLASRSCPECGAAFKPSDFSFTKNAVAFHCPHCSQAYYGTSDDGHLVPSEFTCVKCARYIRMDEMTLTPTQGVAEDLTAGNLNPWVDRRGKRAIAAWGATAARSAFSPVDLLRATPEAANPAAGWRFFMVNLALAVVLGGGFIWMFGFVGGMTTALTQLAILTLLPFCLGLAYTLVWGLLAHGLLRVTGGSFGRFSRVMQCLQYSSGPLVLAAVPCLGWYLAPIACLWWLINACVVCSMEGRERGVRWWRATIAIVVGPILFWGVIAALIAWGISAALQAGTSAMGKFQSPPNTVMSALTAHAAANNGKGPDHAIELFLADQTLMPAAQHGGQFSFSMTSEYSVRAGGATLGAMRIMPKARADQAVAAARSAIGVGTTKPDSAHRVGEWVFMHQGVDLTNPDPGLWILAATDDPATAPGNMRKPTILVVRGDSSVITVRLVDIAAKLQEQNALRTKLGLPTIPDPTTVTHIDPPATPTGGP